MVRVSLLFAVMLFARNSWAGPIADQFRSGYGGVSWGTSLTDLVAMFPNGEHHFSTAPGTRVYLVRSDEPIFDVPRAGTQIQYHLGAFGGVEMIAIDVPYERRDQLMGALYSSFGSYSVVQHIGTAVVYLWNRDDGITMSVRASTDPKFGILEFWISRVSVEKSSWRSK